MMTMKLLVKTTDNIQTILNHHPLGEPLDLILEPGTYRQKLRIRHDHLRIIGHSSADTILVFGDFAWKYHEDGRLYNTFRTPTLTVLGNDVSLAHVTIQNDAGFGPSIGQAIALALYGDDIRVSDCRLLGHQDTLFCGPLPSDLQIRYQGFLSPEELRGGAMRHRFENCLISGNVDFIFGSSIAWFTHCDLQVFGSGYITAPSTPETQPFGFVFEDCRIQNLSQDDRVYLGRPWRSGGATIFLDCRFEGQFAEARWDSWNKPYFRFFESPYHPSLLVQPLTKEETERVRMFLAERFTRS